MTNDMGKIMIIPEQLVMLEEKMAQGILQSDKFKEMTKASLGEVLDRGESGSGIPDSEAHAIARHNATLKATEQILNNYTLIDTYCQDTVEIGTRCQVLITSSTGKSTLDLILIHKRVANEALSLYVSCDTQLGLGLKGCKVGDVVSYKGGHGENFTAEVLKIYTNRLGEKQLEENKEKLR